MMDLYGIDDAACDDLPRGVTIGTVELNDCDGGDWHVRMTRPSASSGDFPRRT